MNVHDLEEMLGAVTDHYELTKEYELVILNPHDDDLKVELREVAK